VKTKRIHILGGGAWQIPTIRLARELGYSVLVSDMYPDAPGFAFANICEQIDIRDVERTLDAARRHKVDGVLCDTTDVGVPTAAFVAEQMGLPGIGLSTARRFTNKRLMREATDAAGIDGPRFAFLSRQDRGDAAVRAIGFPCVVKPTDSQSSRGVQKVDMQADLPVAIEEARAQSLEGGVLVEEWMIGTEITVEAMCFEGSVSVLAISDKEHYPAKPQIASRLTYPAAVSPTIVRVIEACNAAVIRALGLQTGVTHAEFIVSPDGRVRLVEIAARGGGSRIYSHIAPYVSSVPLPQLYLNYCLGDTTEWPAPTSKPRAAVLDFFDVPAGTVQAIEGVEEARELRGIAEIAVEISVGDRFAGVDNDRARPAYLVAVGDERADVEAIVARARALVRITVA